MDNNIQFERFQLSNGLRFLVHQDTSVATAVINVLYDVGAKDEDPNKTGFAHLFEHLMFGGSVNIPNYDEPLQMAGGENNAYTTNDITNYYISLPVENIETAFWLESDRMRHLAFSQESLEVQRKVVCEEFKEHYINKPYGDAWKHLRALAYQQHPYQWMTIGKELSHIEDATLDDVKAFFNKHYNPSNAIVCVAGNVTTEAVQSLAEKWFGDIPPGNKYYRTLAVEPVQLSPRAMTIQADVPFDAIWKAFHISSRLDKEYYIADIISDILGNGKTSRLYNALVKDQQLFSEIHCYQTGSVEPGLLVIEGKLVKGVDPQQADAAIHEVLASLIEEPIQDKELQKIKNRIESMIVFEDMNLMNRANNLAFFELLGNADLMNKELDAYQEIDTRDVQIAAQRIFDINNSNTLFYLTQN